LINPHIRKLISNGYVFIDVKWYKRQCIVVTQDLRSDEFRFYIGLEEMHFTETEPGDILGCMRYGSTFPYHVGQVLFPNIDYEQDSYREKFPEDLI
jgi:hypothetical protein